MPVITQFHATNNKIVKAYTDDLQEFEVTNMIDDEGDETENADECVCIVVKIADDVWMTVDIRHNRRLEDN